MTSSTARVQIKASNFRPCQKNALVGFVTLTMPSGMIIHDCSIHRKNESGWIGMPACRYVKDDGSEGWKPVIDFVDADARRRFSCAALEAVEALGIL
jgi:hypothetical protein